LRRGRETLNRSDGEGMATKKTIQDDEYPEVSGAGAILSQEEDLREMEARCFQLSEYIHDNIVEIIRIREENDRLSKELRGAMAKLKKESFDDVVKPDPMPYERGSFGTTAH
jgi:hypothetical protein